MILLSKVERQMAKAWKAVSTAKGRVGPGKARRRR